MDSERYNQWIRASSALGGVDPCQGFMMIAVQGLARLDCQLIAIDEKFFRLIAEKCMTVPLATKFSDHLTLSYLWILGAYEILRTLDQRAHTTSTSIASPFADKITGIKRLFERVRIPLAKFEASRRSPNDSPIAYPGINSEHGVSWQVAADTFISRRDLADAFLSLLSELRAAPE